MKVKIESIAEGIEFQGLETLAVAHPYFGFFYQTSGFFTTNRKTQHLQTPRHPPAAISETTGFCQLLHPVNEFRVLSIFRSALTTQVIIKPGG